MKMNKKAAAVSLATVLTCGVLAGCDLVTTDSQKDMLQVIAEVDISRGEEFQSGGEYAKYADVIDTSTVLKRDLIANFLSSGYQSVQSGASYSDTFDLIRESLVNRKMLIQYAQVYLFENGDAAGNAYTAEGYRAAVESAENDGKNSPELSGLRYFLTETERAKAEYVLKVQINNTIDSQEKNNIKAEEREYDTSVRTLPTGVNTENEDYYDSSYNIYTGKNKASDCGSYEPIEGSTSTTRKKAYNDFLSNLLSNNLLDKGEDVSRFENLEYYKLELKTAYEDALLDKISKAYEKKAEATLTEAYLTEKFNETLENQRQAFDADKSSFETALDSASDTSFVLYAPNGNYGYVMNILLPFSDTQKNYLTNYTGTEAQKFYARAQVLKNLKATDQRGTWFTGETDYSYEKDGAYYFFEESANATEGSKYEPLKNYRGTYAYNGTVEYDEDEGYTLTPNEIDVDGFIGLMTTALQDAGLAVNPVQAASSDYYAQTDFYKTEDGVKSVDYSKFLYYEAKVNLAFDANEVFVAGTDVNKAMSVINELSFAYNTDTAGLNKYLGYSVSAYNTSFVKEFEYAAKKAVEGGVGTVTVAPSEYGWHIMYCTFSYADQTPYAFYFADVEREGSFSNLYYEALKSATVDGYSNAMQTQVVNAYSACVTVYESRYADLKDLDNQS